MKLCHVIIFNMSSVCRNEIRCIIVIDFYLFSVFKEYLVVTYSDVLLNIEMIFVENNFLSCFRYESASALFAFLEITHQLVINCRFFVIVKIIGQTVPFLFEFQYKALVFVIHIDNLNTVIFGLIEFIGKCITFIKCVCTIYLSYPIIITLLFFNSRIDCLIGMMSLIKLTGINSLRTCIAVISLLTPYFNGCFISLMEYIGVFFAHTVILVKLVTAEIKIRSVVACKLRCHGIGICLCFPYCSSAICKIDRYSIGLSRYRRTIRIGNYIGITDKMCSVNIFGILSIYTKRSFFRRFPNGFKKFIGFLVSGGYLGITIYCNIMLTHCLYLIMRISVHSKRHIGQFRCIVCPRTELRQIFPYLFTRNISVGNRLIYESTLVITARSTVEYKRCYLYISVG